MPCWVGTRSAYGERARRAIRTAYSTHDPTTRSTGRMCRKRPSWAAASSTSRHGTGTHSYRLSRSAGICWRSRSGQSSRYAGQTRAASRLRRHTAQTVRWRNAPSARTGRACCTCRRAASAYTTEARCGCSAGTRCMRRCGCGWTGWTARRGRAYATTSTIWRCASGKAKTRR